MSVGCLEGLDKTAAEAARRRMTFNEDDQVWGWAGLQAQYWRAYPFALLPLACHPQSGPDWSIPATRTCRSLLLPCRPPIHTGRHLQQGASQEDAGQSGAGPGEGGGKGWAARARWVIPALLGTQHPAARGSNRTPPPRTTLRLMPSPAPNFLGLPCRALERSRLAV